MPTILDVLRRRAAGTPAYEQHEPVYFDVQAVRRAVQIDQGLTEKEKANLLGDLDNPETLSSLKAGSLGAIITLLTSKFLKLKPATQLLLSIAGFGLGKIIHDYRSAPKFAPYNSTTKMYEISD